MTRTTTDPHPLPYPISADGDPEMAALIESWRYRGPEVPWEAIVGHEPQIRRCRELAEMLRRTTAELDLLRIRVGAGLVISGPPGVGKSLMARALATALGRDVIVPPTGELGAEAVRRLYAQLVHDGQAVLLLLDEAESIIGHPWQRTVDKTAQDALLAALDGIGRPSHGPITVALTTSALDDLDEAAIRPGRLAPRLVLDKPTGDERRVLLERLVDGLPRQGELDLAAIVDRTGDWSGAELAGAVQEACTRSLLDHSDALRHDLLTEVVAERHVITDDTEDETDHDARERIAIHEAGHVLYGFLNWPGGLASVQIHGRHGQTQLAESVVRQAADAQSLRRHAEMALAGVAAEQVCYGINLTTEGSHHDKEEATGLLIRLLAVQRPYSIEPLEAGTLGDRGSERIRAGWHAELEALAHQAQASSVRWLAPHARVLRDFARLLLDAPEQSLSGDDLDAAIRQAWRRKDDDLYEETSDSAQ